MKAAYFRKPLLVQWIISMIILLPSSMKVEVAAGRVGVLPIAKHGCKDICGNVSIPFPWGFGSTNCFLDEWHEIECHETLSSQHSNHATTTKLPFLKKLGVEVMRIQLASLPDYNVSLPDYESKRVIIRMPPLNACNILADDTHLKQPTSLDLRGGPYWLSSYDNLFVLKGCSGSGVLVDESHTKVAGCATICQKNSTANMETEKCLGVECCQFRLPDGLESYQLHFYRQFIGGHKLGHNCLVLSVVMKDHLDEYVGKPSSSVSPPVALSWGWNSNARTDFNPHTTTCYSDPQYSSAWSCSCIEEYPGNNPYVDGGCEVPLACMSCPGSCVRDRSDDPDTYTCGYLAPLTSLENGYAILVYAILGIAVAPLSLVCYCLWLYRFIKRRRRAVKRVKFFKLMLQRHQPSNHANGAVESRKLFTLKELDKATDHFNDNRVLGKGGQGTVYKGMLTDGRIVAVKKSVQMNESQMEQFINEVVILSQTNHRSVVKLLGCCLETEVPLLAYEYISNGTLHQHIHNPGEDVSLNWATRLKIALDSAGAIAYLHSSSSTPIYHRDIKSANILLDDKYRAKVSDFGISKTLEIDQTHATTLVQGTFGYFDPEYFIYSVYTEKSDVYSFGVVLVELLTSKKSIFTDEEKEQKGLAPEFLIHMHNQTLSSILDPEVVKEAKEEEIARYADLAKRCLNERGRLRPTMREVAMALEMIIKPPNQTHARGEGSLEDGGFDEIACDD